MKVKLDARRLAKACSISKRIVPISTITPSAKYSMLEISEKATLTSTDLESQLELDLGQFELQDIGEGKIMLNLSVLLKFIDKLDGMVSIETKSYNDILIKHENNGERSIRLLEGVKVAESWAVWKSEVTVVDQLGSDFAKKIGWVRKYAAIEESRPVLTGVMMECGKENDELVLAAADGFRLIEVGCGHHTASYRVIILGKACTLIERLMKDQEIAFGLDETGKIASFETDNIKLKTQTINGTFPQYRKLIPEDKHIWTIKLSSKLLHDTLQCFKSSSGITRIEPYNGKLKVSAAIPTEMEFQSLLPAEMEGHGYIAFNQVYMAETARIFNKLEIRVIDHSTPLKIVGDLERVTVVIMPMFVQWEDQNDKNRMGTQSR